MGLWLCLLFLTTVTVVDGYQKLPNGDGTNAVDGNAETLRHAVYKWIRNRDVTECERKGENCRTYNTRQQVVTKYGPIEEWDTSLVTNMDRVFWGADGTGASTFKSQFNADISKWFMGAVTTMSNSKY